MNELKKFAVLDPATIDIAIKNRRKVKNGEIRQRCAEMWLWMLCSPATYGIIVAFVGLRLYFGNWKETAGFAFTYLVEYFIIQHINTKK